MESGSVFNLFWIMLKAPEDRMAEKGNLFLLAKWIPISISIFPDSLHEL